MPYDITSGREPVRQAITINNEATGNAATHATGRLGRIINVIG